MKDQGFPGWSSRAWERESINRYMKKNIAAGFGYLLAYLCLGLGLVFSVDLIRSYRQEVVVIAQPQSKTIPQNKSEVRAWPIWKTVRLGEYKSVDDLRESLKSSGVTTLYWAEDILKSSSFWLSSEKVDVDLVKVSVAELGFSSGATMPEIYAKAKALGLELCPAEVGPALCLQYPDQVQGELLLMGMEAHHRLGWQS